MRNNLVAQRYAKAVLKNVEEQDHQAFRKDIAVLRDLFAEDREYISALNSFLYPLNERLDLAVKITDGLQNPEIWKNLFSILIKKHRFNILKEILTTLDHDILAESKKIKVELTLAFQHDEDTVKRIVKKIEKILKSDVEELRKRYIFEDFHEALIAQTIYAIRMTCTYNGGEKIEERGLVEGKLVFSVVVGNVQQEEIRIPIDEIRIAEFEDAGYLGIQLNQIERINVAEG